MAFAMPPARTYLFYCAPVFFDAGVIPLLAFGVLFNLLGELKATAANIQGRPAWATRSLKGTDSAVIRLEGGIDQQALPPPSARRARECSMPSALRSRERP